MEHLDKSRQLLQRVMNGEVPATGECLDILTATGAQLTAYMASADSLRQQSFGNSVRLCSIVNAKSGRCAENCAFCAQSTHFDTAAPVYPLKSTEEILAAARQAAAEQSHCFGIVTSGTRPAHGAEFDRILAAIRTIRAELPIEPSASLGLLDAEQANALAAAGCVTYHHNLETARSFFPEICTTHDYERDVQTVRLAKQAGMRVCCGGILGLGESLEQRIEFAMTLRDLEVDSVPLNFLNPVAGTPLAGRQQLTPLDCLRAIVLFRHILPDKPISVCGGREQNLRELQAMIFMAGASGTMVGHYLTTTGRDREVDLQLFHDLEVKIDVC
ncbi:MAG: biotin synthase BioB [Desulfuromonadales bacterium]|nr:biotin synthase BioB [Desulfuromonadales bacterium]